MCVYVDDIYSGMCLSWRSAVNVAVWAVRGGQDARGSRVHDDCQENASDGWLRSAPLDVPSAISGEPIGIFLRGTSMHFLWDLKNLQDANEDGENDLIWWSGQRNNTFFLVRRYSVKIPNLNRCWPQKCFTLSPSIQCNYRKKISSMR